MIEATGSAGGTERAADFAAIRTERLCNDYGAGRGVFDLDLEVRRGEVLRFLGPNGASTASRFAGGWAFCPATWPCTAS